MFEFTEKDSFTLEDAFHATFEQAKHLPETVPQEQAGRLEKYIEISRRIEIQAKPENFSLSGLNQLLNEFDDGKSRDYPHIYKEPVPFIETRGEYEYGKILLNTMKAVEANMSKLDLSAFGFLNRGLIRIGLGIMTPKFIAVLEERITAYELSEVSLDEDNEADVEPEEIEVTAFAFTAITVRYETHQANDKKGSGSKMRSRAIKHKRRA